MKIELKKLWLLTLLFLFSACGKLTLTNTNVTVHDSDISAITHNHNFFSVVQSPEMIHLGDFQLAKQELETPSGLFTNKSSAKKKSPFELEINSDYSTLLSNTELLVKNEFWKIQVSSDKDVDLIPVEQADPLAIVNLDDVYFTSSDFDRDNIFTNPFLKSSDKNKDLGKIQNGKYLIGDTVISKLYIMKYKLKADKDNNSHQTKIYYGIVSIPVDKSSQKPLVMFAHGGDYGTSFSEMITLLRSNLSNYVVAAPLYPGEGLCPQIAVQNVGCMKITNQNYFFDMKPHFYSPNIPNMGSVTKFNALRSPAQDDVISYLGMYESIVKKINSKDDIYFQNISILNPTHNSEKAFINFSYYGADGQTPFPLIPKDSKAPHTIGLSASRGGTTLIAALGRIGLLMSANHINFQLTKEYENFQFPLFSGAIFVAPPTSFLTGELRLVFNALITSPTAGIFEKLPMVSDLLKTPAIADYRNDKSPGQSLISYDESDPKTFQDSLTNLVNFVALSDITFLAPFVSTAVQNWDTYSVTLKNNKSNEIIHAMAPGSVIFLHGTADQVVPVSESTIGNEALSGTWGILYGTTYSHSNNNPMKNWKFSNWIVNTNLIFPGLGSSQFIFQPTDEFYNLNCVPDQMSSDKKSEVLFNTKPNIQRCFGHGFSENSDGQDTVGSYYDHLDASFYTSHLVNPVDSFNEDSNLFVLTSNKRNPAFNNYPSFSFGRDLENMSIFENCQNNYFDPTNGVFSAQEWSQKCLKYDINSTKELEWTSLYTTMSLTTNTIKIPLMSPVFKRYINSENQNQELMNTIAYGNYNKKIPSNSVTPFDIIDIWLKTVASENSHITENSTSYPTSLFFDYKTN